MNHSTLRRLILGFCGLALFGPTPPADADHRALLIGVGRYRHLADELPGIDRDLDMMREVVDTFGYTDDQVRVLSHEQATLDGIRRGIEEWLIDGTTPGDRAFLYFTGHGTLVEDGLPGDEADGNDEALLPYDFVERPRGQGGSTMENLLVDDELAELLARIPAAQVVVMVDACHSGTVTRSVQPGPRRFFAYSGAPVGRHSRLLDDSDQLRPDRFRPEQLRPARLRPDQIRRRGPSVVLLSAAQAEEEAQTNARGALFTQAVYRSVRGASDGGYLNVEQLRAEAELFIDRAVGDQRSKAHRPDISGPSHLRGMNLFLPPPQPVTESAVQPLEPMAQPVALESTADRDLWTRLELLVRDADGGLAVDTSRSSYRVGESLEIAISPDHDGYLYVLSLGDGDRSVSLLYPNPFQRDPWVRGGETLRLPDYRHFRLPADLSTAQARRTEGQKNLVVVVQSSRRLDPSVAGVLAEAARESYVAGQAIVSVTP